SGALLRAARAARRRDRGLPPDARARPKRDRRARRARPRAPASGRDRARHRDAPARDREGAAAPGSSPFPGRGLRGARSARRSAARKGAGARARRALSCLLAMVRMKPILLAIVGGALLLATIGARQERQRDLRVFLFAGQSNMAGADALVGETGEQDLAALGAQTEA